MNKILFISNTANFSKFNLPFMNWLRNNSWIVDYASNPDEIVTACDTFYKISMTRFPLSIKNLKAVFILRGILKKGGYKVVHCHTPVGGFVARIAIYTLKKRNQLHVIYTAHGFHFYKGASIVNWILYYPIEKILASITDVLILINDEDYNLAIKRKFKAGKIVKIDGVGVNLDKYCAHK